MKQILLLSFDLVSEGEPNISLSIASLLAYLKQDKRYGNEFMVSHIGFNMLDFPHLQTNEIIEKIRNKHNLAEIDFIAIACYIWSEYLVNPLIKKLREKGFKKKIILGGYQISYANDIQLQRAYPDCQIFIKGYAEESLLKAIFQESSQRLTLNEAPNFLKLPSPYLSGEIIVNYDQAKIRFETKRGCPYRCSFCAHRDLQRNKVYRHINEKITRELLFLKEKRIKKINVVDPVFNMGQEYLNILEKMVDLDIKSLITFQTRVENIKGTRGQQFLNLCSKLNVHLEFGLQTIHDKELNAINRRNNLSLLKETLKNLTNRGISFEASLIYGLPNQTIDSFKASINFLQDNECEIIKAFPLMLLRGTELYNERKKWQFKEDVIGEFNIPVVVSSRSFDRYEWELMKKLANSLKPSERY